jgi:multidrug efflux system membrane fusion protein
MLIDTKRQVVVVPTGAVQRGPNGPFVFIVQADDTVVVRPVTVSQQDDVQAVIATGLQAGERVVTTGFAQLAEGTRVRVSSGESGEQPRSTQPADGGRRQNRPAGAEGSRQNESGTRPAGPRTPDRRSSSGAAASPSP